MKIIIILLCLVFSSLAFADLKSIEAKNLDFYYIFPQGHGELEKLNISIKGKSITPVSFDIFALNPGFSIVMPFFQLDWSKEEKILEGVKELKVKSSQIILNKSKHTALVEEVILSHEILEKMSMRKMRAFCEGISVSQDLGVRLVDDCLSNSKLSIEEFYLPFGRVIIGEMIENLPDQTDEDIQSIPNDVEWESVNGKFSLAAKVKLLVKSRIKVKGDLKVDYDSKVLTVRLDEVKFGILSIYDLAFKEIEKRIKDPKITVKKPFIYYHW